ncbi:hypothetical protein PVL29_008139 [Vitis rotundifolia]|uniref:AT-hook motif nuclear-localized protein n=1 Tax=Vitis rotundifolia TaxID=103349 RepID=A0AA39A1W8_VITRO|nr:hypothetical protein PVL29_008139 [Vitis rotundifolia]
MASRNGVRGNNLQDWSSKLGLIIIGSGQFRVGYLGRFEIISLSGSFTAGEIIGGPEDGGMLNILLGNSDGGVFGGGLAGSLIAASPIQLVCGGLEKKQTHREPKRRRGAKPSVAASLPGNSNAERVLTPMTEPADGDKNFMTLASAVSELTNGAGDATFVGQSMILTSLDSVDENTSQSSQSILDQRTSTNN